MDSSIDGLTLSTVNRDVPVLGGCTVLRLVFSLDRMSAGGPAARRCGGFGTDGLNTSACVSHFQGRDGARNSNAHDGVCRVDAQSSCLLAARLQEH